MNIISRSTANQQYWLFLVETFCFTGQREDCTGWMDNYITLQQNTNVTGIKWTTRISRWRFYTDNFTLSDWSLCTWSWIRDLRGEITKVTPAPISPVSWKHRLFPPPVGIKIKQSSFIIAALMASSWFVLNERMLYTFFNIFHISLWYGKSFRFSSTAKGRENNKPGNYGPVSS